MPGKARAFSDRALLLQPREPRDLSTRARLELQVGATSEGKEYLEQLVDRARVTGWTLLEKSAIAAFIPLAARIVGDHRRLDLARDTADEAVTASGMPPFMRLYGRIGLALVAVERGDAELAEPQYEAFESQRGTAVMMAGISVDRLLGLLARTMGRWDVAVAHLEAALGFCGQAGYRPEYAWAACDYAETLRLGSGPSSIQRGSSSATRSRLPNRSRWSRLRGGSRPSEVAPLVDPTAQRHSHILFAPGKRGSRGGQLGCYR